MPEETFWRCTFRKLFALFEIYKKVNGIAPDEQTPSLSPSAYLDPFI